VGLAKRGSQPTRTASDGRTFCIRRKAPDTAAYMDLSISFYHGACPRTRSTPWSNPSASHGEYAYADKYIGGDSHHAGRLVHQRRSLQ
jgi:hypothetical protein